MKKLLALALCLGTLLLVACSRQTVATWLVGQWRSEAWNVVYDFEQEGETWTVRAGQELLWEEMTLTNGDGQWILTAPDGTKLIIQQLTDQQLTLYQAPAEGLVGLTAQVEFERIEK